MDVRHYPSRDAPGPTNIQSYRNLPQSNTTCVDDAIRIYMYIYFFAAAFGADASIEALQYECSVSFNVGNVLCGACAFVYSSDGSIGSVNVRLKEKSLAPCLTYHRFTQMVYYWARHALPKEKASFSSLSLFFLRCVLTFCGRTVGYLHIRYDAVVDLLWNFCRK